MLGMSAGRAGSICSNSMAAGAAAGAAGAAAARPGAALEEEAARALLPGRAGCAPALARERGRTREGMRGGSCGEASSRAAPPLVPGRPCCCVSCCPCICMGTDRIVCSWCTDCCFCSPAVAAATAAAATADAASAAAASASSCCRCWPRVCLPSEAALACSTTADPDGVDIAGLGLGERRGFLAAAGLAPASGLAAGPSSRISHAISPAQ